MLRCCSLSGQIYVVHARERHAVSLLSSPDVHDVFTAMKLDHVFDIRESEAEALAAFESPYSRKPLSNDERREQ